MMEYRLDTCTWSKILTIWLGLALTKKVFLPSYLSCFMWRDRSLFPLEGWIANLGTLIFILTSFPCWLATRVSFERLLDPFFDLDTVESSLLLCRGPSPHRNQGHPVRVVLLLPQSVIPSPHLHLPLSSDPACSSSSVWSYPWWTRSATLKVRDLPPPRQSSIVGGSLLASP